MNYELDTYLDALQFFPNDSDMLELAKGRAFLVKKDIFRNLMWYTLADSNKQYPLTIDTVKRIKAQNKQGIRPEELETAEVITGKPKEIEPEYADLVGQISLKTLEKTTRKRKEKERGQQQRQQGGGQQRNQPNQPNQQRQSPPQPNQQRQGSSQPNQQRQGPSQPNQQRQGPPPRRNNQQQSGGQPRNQNKPQQGGNKRPPEN